MRRTGDSTRPLASRANLTVQSIIRKLRLKPHPEGGFYRETYRDSGMIAKATLPPRFRGDRNYSTAIFCLYPRGSLSRLHRISSDEVWHFYLGGPMTIVELRRGSPRKTVLGADLSAGQRLQHVVRAGTWFGAYPNPGTDFCLAGCTVAPGFDFDDFELGEQSALLKRFPGARAEILRLT